MTPAMAIVLLRRLNCARADNDGVNDENKETSPKAAPAARDALGVYVA